MAEIAPYGETPLSVMHKIARKAGITAKDVVFELGCGRGRTCFWLASWIGCKTVGIEFVPTFIQKAAKVRAMFKTPNVEFRQEDMFTTSLAGASVIYLYGTCLTDEEVLKLIERCKELPAGTKIITISYSLLEYTDLPQFELIKTVDVSFAWGSTQAYIQIIN
ncbi:MAG: class I SAM-dependent methyltransferase, partial [Verrucomicrobia bacterium]|nr:class I SAM-dependent methyltransferase [Verrucomicrobiota bacterium]